MSLEPIYPERALELYIADHENNVTQGQSTPADPRFGHFI